MTINFTNVGLWHKRLIQKIYKQALKLTSNDLTNVEVNVGCISAEEIRTLNKQHRDVDRETDVLSFPMLDITYKQTLVDFSHETDPSGILNLGDIVICKEVAQRQAKEYGHSYKRELAFLALHGLLHLLGYDHIEKTDEKVMMTKSEEILTSLKIKRGKNV